MPQPKPAQYEGVSQVAGRILVAWRSGHGESLEHALQHARLLTDQADRSSTFEMERVEALQGAVESIENGLRRQTGAVRLLEHLAQPAGILG
jgi:hypothetical protein